MKIKLFVILAVLLCGAAYYLVIKQTGLAVPCKIRVLTGFKCPGCGLTHMAMNLINLNFREAFEANRFVFITSPFIMFELIYIYFLEKDSKVNYIALVTYLIAFLSFGVIRNFIGW